jgi:hypothetical protein
MTRITTAAVILAAAGLGLLAAACGGTQARHVARLSSTTITSGTAASSPPVSAQQADALAFSRCMRSHGLPSFPDPSSSGTIPKVTLEQLGVSSSRFQVAQSACRNLLPNGGSGPTPAQLQQDRAQALRFSACMRTHGVPNFPDPAGSGRIPDPSSLGINQGSPKFEAANQACRAYRPPYIPSNAAYSSWARTHQG